MEGSAKVKYAVLQYCRSDSEAMDQFYVMDGQAMGSQAYGFMRGVGGQLVGADLVEATQGTSIERLTRLCQGDWPRTNWAGMTSLV